MIVFIARLCVEPLPTSTPEASLQVFLRPPSVVECNKEWACKNVLAAERYQDVSMVIGAPEQSKNVVSIASAIDFSASVNAKNCETTISTMTKQTAQTAGYTRKDCEFVHHSVDSRK